MVTTSFGVSGTPYLLNMQVKMVHLRRWKQSASARELQVLHRLVLRGEGARHRRSLCQSARANIGRGAVRERTESQRRWPAAGCPKGEHSEAKESVAGAAHAPRSGRE